MLSLLHYIILNWNNFAWHIQLNLNNSNTDGSFIMANSNSFLSPYEILPLAQENKYLEKIFLFYHEIVCCVYSLESPHWGVSNEYTQHTIIVKEIKKAPKLSLFASWPGTMINPQWLELSMSRTFFMVPKMFEPLKFDCVLRVRAFEVRLCITW